MRALIVDDSRAMRSHVKRMLTGIGLEVVEAENGRDALDRLDTKGPFDVALVDWNMPVMDGYEFVESATGRGDIAGMKIVMVSSVTDTVQIARVLAAGAHDYLMKPFDEAGLAEKLRIVGLSF